jgi:Terminase RNaseH-like domain
LGSSQIEAGNVYLPHPAIEPWVEDLIEECAAFPYATHDDQVDALTQALSRLQGTSRTIYPVLESEIAIDPIEIPAHWPCVFGMDARLTETAAILGAFDPTADILYVYSEHCQSSAEPAIHAHAIGSLGKWIPGYSIPRPTVVARATALTYYESIRNWG